MSAGRAWTNFDFVLGRWRIGNRKLKTVLPEEPRTGWFEFESTADPRRLLKRGTRCR